MVVFEQKKVIFGKKWLYSGGVFLYLQSACIRTKVVVFGKSGCIWAKVIAFGQNWL